MCGRSASGRSAAVLMTLTGAHRLGATRGYTESFNVAPGNYLMTLVQRPVSDSKQNDDDVTKQPADYPVNDVDDIIVVPHDVPANTDEEVCKPESKDEHPDDDNDAGAASTKEVVLEAMKWGLVPWFTKPEEVTYVGSQAINARSETVSQKAFFRHLVNRRRCVVVMDGFFEWKKYEVLGQPRKQAHFVLPNPPPLVEGIEPPPQPLLYLAGLWDIWQAKDSQEKLVTCTILTTEATSEFGGIHDRMPVVLRPEDVPKWLDTDKYKFDQLRDLLPPYKDNGLTWYEVTDKVNSVKNKSAENIEPLALHKAKGIGRFFAKPKSVGDEGPAEAPAPAPRPAVDDDDVIVVGRSLTPPAQAQTPPAQAQAPPVQSKPDLPKSPPKRKKIEQLPGQKSLTSFFK